MKATTSEIYIMHDTVNIMDDRGDLDLTKQIDNLKQQVEGLKILIDLYKRQLWEQRLLSSQLESSNNLLQGYKKVIQQLTDKLKQKEL